MNDKIKEADLATKNLVSMVDEEELKKIGLRVVEDFENDLSSRMTWETKRKNWVKLFMGHVDTKTFPWPNCSNVPIPILTTAVIQFQARAYEALLPAKEKVRVDKTGEEDILRAERVEKYMNYQLNYEMEDFEEGWDVSLFQLPINGSIFRKTYFDPAKGHNVSSYCSAEEVVVPYHTKATETPSRITHVLYKTKNDLAIGEILGIYENVKDLPETSLYATGLVNGQIRQESDKIEGVLSPVIEKKDSPRVILEQHRLWDLDGDGIDEPYVISVDRESNKVIRIYKRYFIDEFNTEQTIDYFTHYYFFPNPEGYYGCGFGHVLEGINEAAKTILNQIIDAGTLANMSGKTGFYNKRSGVKKGDMSFKLGEYKGVDVPSDDIKNSIYSFEFPGPSNVLFRVLGLLQDYGVRVTTVSETMTGEMPKSDTPATAIVSAIEQGMKVFSAIHKRIHRIFKKELKKIYRLNWVYGDNERYMRVMGDKYLTIMTQLKQKFTIESDFAGDIDVIPTSDPTITSRTEKIAIAEQVLARVMENPATAQDPNKRRSAYERFFKALNVPNYEELLEQPQEPKDIPAVEENSMMLRDEMAQVLPQQNHLEHIDEHDAMMQTMYAEELSPHGKNLMKAHRQQHIAEQYKKEKGGEQNARPESNGRMGEAGRNQEMPGNA